MEAATLANFFYQYVIKHGRKLTYKKLDEIVEANLGKDITEGVNAYVYSNFGHNSGDLHTPTPKVLR